MILPAYIVSVFYWDKLGSSENSRLIFFGARIWLRMTFNYPVLWVGVKGQG